MALNSKDKQALEQYRAKCKLIQESTTFDQFEGEDAKQARINKAKNDFRFMVQYYFPHYAESPTPDFHVRLAKKVKKNPKYKGWAKWARGHAKSVVDNVLIPAWLWLNDDIHFMVLIGQNETKAQMLLADLQAEFESNQRIINDFGNQVTFGSWEDGFFKTKNGFIAKALGMGQDPRGLRVGAIRPDYISCDDWEIRETVKNPKRQKELAEWLLRSVIPSMDNGNRRVIISQNHFAPQMIFSLIIDMSDSWDIDQVNAYDPITYKPTWNEKYSDTFFKEVEEEIGTLAAHAEYNNQPHVEGTLFTDEMIQWSKLPSLKSFDAIVGRWDVAYGGTKTSDFNAIPVWGLKDGKKYKIDCFCKQSKIIVALRWIADFQRRLPSDVKVQFGFEAQFWNDEIYRVIDEVEKEYGFRLNLIKVERSKSNKYDRMITMLPQYQNGRVFYSEHLKSSNDNQVAIAQLKGIEPGYKTKDDAPDADEMCFAELDRFDRTRSYKSTIKPRTSRKY